MSTREGSMPVLPLLPKHFPRTSSAGQPEPILMLQQYALLGKMSVQAVNHPTCISGIAAYHYGREDQACQVDPPHP